ncbi:MAG: tyrosine-type recombinase/integrase [Oryzomonas sp.]
MKAYYGNAMGFNNGVFHGLRRSLPNQGIGLSKLIDTLYSNAAISRPHLACHALRHTCGAQLYQQTRDVKVVQETLRHATIAMAAKHGHIQDRGKARHTQSIPIKSAWWHTDHQAASSANYVSWGLVGRCNKIMQNLFN